MLRTQNLHVVKTEPLVAPRVIKRELPGSDALYEVVVRARATIRDIIAGRDRRLLAVVGPCSIHDPEAALDYAGRLGTLAERLADKLFVVMRVGFKNTTDGNQQVAINALESARRPHTFLGIDQDGAASIIHTEGNPDGHIILRGGRTPNYDAESIRRCEELLVAAGLPARVLVDCSHAQTAKDFTRQPRVLDDLVVQMRAGNRSIMGFMLESNLEAGNQKLAGGRAGLRYGVSITDACVDWPTTERSLTEAAAGLA